MRVRSPQDVAGGAALIVLAAIALHQAQELPVGRAARMGPGYFPTMLAIIIAGFGALIAFGGLRADGPRLQRWSPRRIIPVMAGIVWFALTIRTLGLVAAGAGLFLISSLAAPDFHWRGSLIFGAAVVAFAAVLFPILLGLPLPIWPRL